VNKTKIELSDHKTSQKQKLENCLCHKKRTNPTLFQFEENPTHVIVSTTCVRSLRFSQLIRKDIGPFNKVCYSHGCEWKFLLISIHLDKDLLDRQLD